MCVGLCVVGVCVVSLRCEQTNTLPHPHMRPFRHRHTHSHTHTHTHTDTHTDTHTAGVLCVIWCVMVRLAPVQILNERATKELEQLQMRNTKLQHEHETHR